MKRMVIDTANLLFRVASAHGKYNSGGDPKDQAGLAMHMALMSIRSQYNKHKPDQVAITFEGGQNWRKAHTRGERPEPAVSKILYKGNRVKDDSMIPYFELMESFQQLARQHTSLVVLQNPILEGDDLVSGYARKFSALGDDVVVLSDDKDFCTLLQLPNVRLIRPDGTERKLGKDKMPDDAEYFMYEKAFRGDGGDNVLPAFPRVRATKLRAAFDAKKKGDHYQHTNLMNERWKHTYPATGETVEFRVGDLFDENVLLMDLINGQPPDIQALISETIDKAIVSHGAFSLFQFQKFCGRYELKKISEEIMNFVPLLSSTGINNPDKLEKPAVESKVLPKKAPRKSTLVF